MTIISVLSGCLPSPKPNSFQDILNRGTLRVGTLYGNTSYYIGPQGPVGFEYELAKKYADSMGLKLQIVPSYNLEELFPKIENGEVDILAAGLTITPERLKKYRFSPSYSSSSQHLIFKQGAFWPKTLDEVKGSLVVTAHSSHAEFLSSVQQKYPNLSWQETNEYDSDELIEAVQQERLDYTIADSITLAINRRYYPEVSSAITLQDEKPLAWVVSKHSDDSLFASLVEFFGKAHHDGTLLTLEDKYYGHIQSFDYVDTRTFIKAIDNKLPKYQSLFEQYGEDIDWRFLAAISYQESHWNPEATSYTGVRGLMMLTLPTAKQVGVTSRTDPEQSIRGGAKYFQQMIKKIPARIKEPDRRWFALAAYNIGWGHLEDARIITQRKGGDPDRWVEVKESLPLLKQRKYYKNTKYGYARGDEPVRYVENIRAYYDTLVFMTEKKSEMANSFSPAINMPEEAVSSPN
ncbi:membrane-bound lytic murein transglycosylase MltF [Thalassotalea aquiviva]|uniref:membrane-bound lytic murein transglycosylase MltF n=1 Tax=Thalassotalea aquiviva TaxID=3242415 RepID=UPI00352A973E